MGKITILVVEDEAAIQQLVSYNLIKAGFNVSCADSGEEALDILLMEDIDCILLDLMLPGMSGLEVCEKIRRKAEKSGSYIPIVMLTAKGEEEDIVEGLEYGADDYVTKPFAIGELVARIRALFRRAGRSVRPSQAEIRIGNINIETGSQTLTRGSDTMHLSFYEVELLKFLWEREGEPVSRDEILEKIWGLEAGPNNRTVDNFIVKLRRKIEPKPDRPIHILTVYGVGYKLVC